LPAPARSSPSPSTQHPAGSRPAAPTFSGKTINSDLLERADLRGKVIVLNMWGSWCAPCRAEAPDPKKASDDTRDLGVRFVGVDTRDNDRAATAFERTYGITYPSFRDPDGKLLLGFNGRISLSAVASHVQQPRRTHRRPHHRPDDGHDAGRATKDLAAEKARQDDGGAAK